VHAGIEVQSDRIMQVAPEAGACIHHLSHPDVASWIERTNRYTSRADRHRVEAEGSDLIGFAHARIAHWMERTDDDATSGYPAAVALLRAIYDMVDRLKTWEEARGIDGAVLFRQVCARLDARYGNGESRGDVIRQGSAPFPMGWNAVSAWFNDRIAANRP
jgi:hypothetical protein